MTALVTGASRGIGRATALAFASRGIPVALLGRPSDALDRALEDVRALSVVAEAFHCDLAKPGDIEKAARAAVERFGAPRAVVHNAAVLHRAKVDDMTDAEWDDQLAVNVRAPFQLTRALLPAMKHERSGRIVYVASISATLGTPRLAAYCASKWALVGFMKSLAEELSDTGLMTCAVLPGSVDTAMLAGSGFTPRMTAEDVARTIVHYATEAPLAHNGGIVEMFGT